MTDALTKALAEHGNAINDFREEVSAQTGELRQRVTGIEQAVAKGLRSAALNADDGPAHFNLDELVNDSSFQRVKSDSRSGRIGFELGQHSIKSLINLVTDDPSSGNTTYATPATRLPGRLLQPLAPLRLIGVLPSRPVDSNKIEYVQLTSSGGAEVQDGEGEQKAEMDFEGLLVTANVATIAVHTTASVQVLDDAPGLSALIERVMRNSVMSKAEEQLITGSGTGNYVNGLYTQATWLSTGQDGVPERIGKGLVTMETSGFSPDLVLMNPNDWFDVSILKDDDGNYIYGNPASPAAPSLWNRRVITSPKIPEGSALIGDSSQVTILDRQAPRVYFTRDHKDYATRNLVLILVEARLGLELYNTAGFRKIDLGASG